MLGVLALLAVAGAFLIFGLLSGYLRLSERVAEAEMVKTIADGLDSGLQIVDQQGVVLYRNRALQRLTGRRHGRHATLEELFAGEPDSAQAFFRLNRAAERGETRDEEFYVRSRPGGGASGRWLRVGVRPFLTPARAGARGNRLTLWQVADITRERTREIETVSGLEVDARLLRQPAAGAVRRGPRRAHRPRQRDAVALAAPAAGSRAHADAARHRAGRRRRPDPRRCAHRERRTTRLELDLLREDGRAFPAQLVCRGHGPQGHRSPCSCSTAARSSRAPRRTRDAEMRLTRAVPVGAVRHRHRRRRRAHRHLQRRLHAHVRGRGPRRADDGRRPRARRRGAGRRASSPRRCERAVSGRTGAAPIEVFVRRASASWRGASMSARSAPARAAARAPSSTSSMPPSRRRSS